MSNRNRPGAGGSGQGGQGRKPRGGGQGRAAGRAAAPHGGRRSERGFRNDRARPAVEAAGPVVEADEGILAAEGNAAAEEGYLAGKHPVLEALRAGRSLNKIWLSEHAQRHLIQPILEEAKARGVVVQYTDKRKLDQMSGGAVHQGVVAQAASAVYADVDDLLARAAERGEPPLLVLLDEIEDPHNLGSVLRTADCTGVHGVIVPKRRSAGLTATVAKTSAGAVEYVPVARVANLAQTIDKLKEAGVWIAGADVTDATDVYRSNLTGPLAIVIGSEGRGLSRLVRDKCDFLLSLPMFGRINSLNASVAAGVILYEAVRQRRAGGGAGAGGGEGHASP